MDLNKLLEPYSEGGLRTIGGQIKWLLKYVPQDSVDYAISNVYTRMDTGEVFESGEKLDYELLRIAKEHDKNDLEEKFSKKVKDFKKNLDTENFEWNKMTKWQKIKEVLLNKA